MVHGPSTSSIVEAENKRAIFFFACGLASDIKNIWVYVCEAKEKIFKNV